MLKKEASGYVPGDRFISESELFFGNLYNFWKLANLSQKVSSLLGLTFEG